LSVQQQPSKAPNSPAFPLNLPAQLGEPKPGVQASPRKSPPPRQRPVTPAKGNNKEGDGGGGDNKKSSTDPEPRAPQPLPDFNAVHFVNAVNGWIVGHEGTILHSTDGGKSWLTQASGTRTSLTAIAFTDSNTGWAVGIGGTILHSTDGGKSWIT
jgi:hypothetical protein